MKCETCGSELVRWRPWLAGCPNCCPLVKEPAADTPATDEPPREKDAIDAWKRSLPVAECIGYRNRKRKWKINGERYLCANYLRPPLKPTDTLKLGEVSACIHETITRCNAVRGEKPQRYTIRKARRFVRIDEKAK